MNVLQALLDQIHLRRQQLAAKPDTADATALGCLQAAVLSKLAQAEARAAAAELRAEPAWGPQRAQQVPQLSEQSVESATLSLARPDLPSPVSQPALVRPPPAQPLQLVPVVALRRLDAARAALPQSPFAASCLRPAPTSPRPASAAANPLAAAASAPQPFVPFRPAPGRTLTPATVQLLSAARAQPPESPSLVAARLAMLQLRFAGSAAGTSFASAAQPWSAAP